MKENISIQLEPLNVKHGAGVMKIFNYYVESTTSAFAPSLLPDTYFEMILKRTEGYPAYVLIDTAAEDHVAGFCFLASYNPFATFNSTANITCFIEEGYTGLGLGKICLKRLEEDALLRGISNLIANISTENRASIRFHQKNGFEIAGELKDAGEKFNRTFGVVYMQKRL